MSFLLSFVNWNVIQKSEQNYIYKLSNDDKILSSLIKKRTVHAPKSLV